MQWRDPAGSPRKNYHSCFTAILQLLGDIRVKVGLGLGFRGKDRGEVGFQ